MMESVLGKLPIQMMHMGLAKLRAAKPSAEVLAENPMPEVGASIIDAHYLLFSCEAYLVVHPANQQQATVLLHL
jgi:hypothetical protein